MHCDSAFSSEQLQFVVLEYGKTNSLISVRRKYRLNYHLQPNKVPSEPAEAPHPGRSARHAEAAARSDGRGPGPRRALVGQPGLPVGSRRRFARIDGVEILRSSGIRAGSPPAAISASLYG